MSIQLLGAVKGLSGEFVHAPGLSCGHRDVAEQISRAARVVSSHGRWVSRDPISTWAEPPSTMRH